MQKVEGSSPFSRLNESPAKRGVFFCPRTYRGDAIGIEVDACDLEAGFGEGHGERESGIAEPDDADAGLARGDALVEGERRGGEPGGRVHVSPVVRERVSP